MICKPAVGQTVNSGKLKFLASDRSQKQKVAGENMGAPPEESNRERLGSAGTSSGWFHWGLNSPLFLARTCAHRTLLHDLYKASRASFVPVPGGQAQPRCSRPRCASRLTLLINIEGCVEGELQPLLCLQGLLSVCPPPPHATVFSSPTSTPSLAVFYTNRILQPQQNWLLCSRLSASQNSPTHLPQSAQLQDASPSFSVKTVTIWLAQISDIWFQAILHCCFFKHLYWDITHVS